MEGNWKPADAVDCFARRPQLMMEDRGTASDQSFIMSNVLHRADLSTQILPQKMPQIYQI